MAIVKTVAEQTTRTKWWEGKASVDEAALPATNTKSLQTLTFSTNSFNDKERTFVAIASTPVVDRYGDIVQQDGWVLDNFIKNPVIPWAHDYSQPPVGRVTEIGINEQGNLQFKYQAPPQGAYPFADTIWNLYRNQFMFAFSVGFNAIEAEGDWQEGFEFKQQELLEISAVVVPANPQAVALAFDKGIFDMAQLKDLKDQLNWGIKNINSLIAKQGEDDKDTKTVGEVEVKVSLDASEVKELVKSINAAAERLETATKDAQAVEHKDAISTSLPINDDKAATWDAGEATKRVKTWASNDDGDIDFTKYKKAFFWVDPDNADKQGGYKLGFADVVDGELKAIWRGVSAVMAVLNGGRGGVDIPEADKKAVYAQVKKYYAKFDEEAPELKSLTTPAAIDDTNGMTTKAGATLSKANKEKLKAIHDDLKDMAAKCNTHMGVVAEMLKLEGDEDGAGDEQTKAVDQKVEQKDAGETQATDEAETKDDTVEATDDEQQQGDDDATSDGDGEVNSGTDDKDANEGADQKGTDEASKTKSAEGADEDELVDPENLTPEQAEKIAAAVNDELDKLKKN